MTSQSQQYIAVYDLLERYFDGLFNCDTEQLETVFHPQAIYATASDGALTLLDMAHYFPIVDARIPPASINEPKVFSVDKIEFIGPVTAMAQVRMSMLGNDYIDVLTLLKVEGIWRIMSKIFHVEAQS